MSASILTLLVVVVLASGGANVSGTGFTHKQTLSVFRRALREVNVHARMRRECDTMGILACVTPLAEVSEQMGHGDMTAEKLETFCAVALPAFTCMDGATGGCSESELSAMGIERLQNLREQVNTLCVGVGGCRVASVLSCLTSLIQAGEEMADGPKTEEKKTEFCNIANAAFTCIDDSGCSADELTTLGLGNVVTQRETLTEACSQ